MIRPELSLILPVHNEATIIEHIYLQIRKDLDKLRISYECILIENGSTDATWDIVKKLKNRFPNTRIYSVSQGYGNAIQCGLQHARGIYVCYMPSDGQIASKWINILFKEMKKGKWDMIKIKRQSRETIGRTITSFILRIITMLLFSSRLTDINGSPRIFKQSNIRILHLSAKDSFIDVEFAAKIAKLKWNTKEISVPNLSREGGKSTRSYKTYIEFIINMWKYKRGFLLKNWQKNTHP